MREIELDCLPIVAVSWLGAIAYGESSCNKQALARLVLVRQRGGEGIDFSGKVLCGALGVL